LKKIRNNKLFRQNNVDFYYFSLISRTFILFLLGQTYGGDFIM